MLHTDTLGEATRALSGAALVVEQEFCVNLRSRQKFCDRCAERCPSDALTLTIDAVQLDPERCTACGSCTTVCRGGVLRLSGFSLRRLTESFADQTEVHLHCVESRDQGGGTVIPCFQGIDARIYAVGLGNGVERFRLHGLDRCAGCEKGNATQWVEAQRQQLQEWFGEKAPQLMRAEGGVSAEGEKIRSDQVQVSRRGFLKLAVAKVSDTASGWFVPDDDSQEYETPLPFYQAEGVQSQRPVLAQVLLAECADSLPWLEDSLPWTPRGIDSDCTGCLSCGQRCPTGALVATEATGGRRIDFVLHKCTDCRLCEQVCPTDAIRRQESATTAQWGEERPNMLMRMLHRQCSMCGHPYLPSPEEDDGFCPTCSNERDLDNEWFDMLSG